jgi:flavin reductase (DIM6/NTAB) family NADH-FMN oxidoreductase RutF
VVNIPPANILGKLWKTAEKFPYGVNEIEEAGLTQIPSFKVSLPG